MARKPTNQPIGTHIAASLRIKTLLVIGLALAVLLLTGTLPLEQIILSGFQHIEDQSIRTDLTRVQKAISIELERLDATVRAWSSRNDTYIFADGPTQLYIDINTSDNLFNQYDINLMLFLDRTGHVIYSKAYNLETKTAQPVPPELLSRFGDQASIPRFTTLNSSVSGVVVLPEGQLLLVARPILTSAGFGPSNGTVLFGRYLNANTIAKLSTLTQRSFTVEPTTALSLTPDQIEQLLAGQPIVHILNSTTITGYQVVADLEHRPVAAIRLELARDIYAQGESELRYIRLALAAGGILIGIVTLGLIEILVLRRIISIDRRVAHIGASDDANARLIASGNDELAHLTHSINAMLAGRQHMQAEQEQLEQARIADLERVATEQRELVGQLQASLSERAALSQAIRELSAPVLPVLPATLVVPLVGIFDTERAQELQQNVLHAVETQRATRVILDVTGVPLLDSQVAQILINLSAALRLLGAQAILVGIRPEVAQTLVQLGVSLADQEIAANLQSAVMALAAPPH